MKLNKISISGYTNIKHIELETQDIIALVAPNNYGKSNVLNALKFGVDFIEGSLKQKQSQMNYRPVIPINTKMENMPFSFEIEGTVNWNKKECTYIYGYSFEWAKTNNKENGTRITKEYLKIKTKEDLKYRRYINRNETNSANYLASPTGRCSKQLPVVRDLLALNKLDNYDDLFYIEVIRHLNNLTVKNINTLENPDKYFLMIAPDDDINDYSIAFPHTGKIGFFINSLKKLMPDKYELLYNTVTDLLPNIEKLEPIQIDLRKQTHKAENLPFRMPDIYYDIQVKEKYNNQFTSINRISTGCKKILYVLSLTIAAEINNISLITFEELENSVHTNLLQNLLITISQLAGDTKVVITSHSPHLINYMQPSKIKIGIPTDNGIANFKSIKKSKIKKILRNASSEENSLGEYLFDMMLNIEDDEELLKEYFI